MHLITTIDLLDLLINNKYVLYVQGVSGGIVSILGGGSADYSE